MSETFKTALDAALEFHRCYTKSTTKEEVLATAKLFYRELAVAAPSGVDEYTEEWYSQVYAWLRVLNGDQFGCVSDAVRQVAVERNPPKMVQAQPPTAYAPVPEAWALLDKLNGPQPYPGTAAPIGPLVTRDELDRELARLGGDPRNAGDVEAAVAQSKHQTEVMQKLSEILCQAKDESLLAAATRVMKELAEFRQRDLNSPPAAVPGTSVRIRTLGADPLTSTTVAAELEWSPAEGFVAFVPAGAFSEAAKDQLEENSVKALQRVLAPAGLHGSLIQQIKQLVGTAQNRLRRIQDLEDSRRTFEGWIRALLHAQPESESDDHYCPEQPTLDAVLRVIQRLVALDSNVDGSMTRDDLLDDIQQTWHDDGHKPLESE